MSDRVAIDPASYAAAAAQTLENATAAAAETAGAAAGELTGVAGAAGADPLSAAMTLDTGQWPGHAGVIGTATGTSAAQRAMAATETAVELTGADIQNAGQIAKQA